MTNKTIIDPEGLKKLSETMGALHDHLVQAGLAPDPEGLSELSRAMAKLVERMFPNGLPAGLPSINIGSPQLVEQPYRGQGIIEAELKRSGLLDEGEPIEAANDD
ncbi:hypothetical protein [Sphingopyxis witflariensis]|uniref:Uncharacterized protein n=1 Tax=Sphingopyxis witflariensis TaxID=173675 RepID=A0A2D0AN04_9SPHN|nr:hypothetical protein [Sphingopyxis witflariensis]OWQ95119.1 hypothetical protein CDQ91_14455 [Sphingopyxis witflariensis]